MGIKIDTSVVENIGKVFSKKSKKKGVAEFGKDLIKGAIEVSGTKKRKRKII